VVVADAITTTEIATIKTVINIFSVEIKERPRTTRLFLLLLPDPLPGAVYDYIIGFKPLTNSLNRPDVMEMKIGDLLTLWRSLETI
jgi:hypothetical protein